MFRVCQLFQLVSFLQATFACSSPACWETATGRAVCAWLWQIHTHTAHTVYVGNILDMQWQMIFWKYSRPKKHNGSVNAHRTFCHCATLVKKSREELYTWHVPVLFSALECDLPQYRESFCVRWSSWHLLPLRAVNFKCLIQKIPAWRKSNVTLEAMRSRVFNYHICF